MRNLSLETKYFKTRSNDSFKAYKKQKLLQQIVWKGKIIIFRNLIMSFVTDNKNF